MSRGGTTKAAGAPGNPGGDKAAARAVRAAAARAERQRRARIARLRRLAIVLGAAVVVLALVLVLVARRESDGGSASTAIPTGLTSYQGVSGSLDGPATAPVTITLFEDFQCPYCESLEKNTGAEFTALAAQGKVRIIYSMVSFLDIDSANHYSSRAANAYYCAPQRQRKALHTALYAQFPAEDSRGPSDTDLVAEAKTVGIDSPAYTACVSSHRFSHFATVTQIGRLAALTKIGTPTMLVNGKLYPNAQTLTPAQLDALVAQVSGS